MIKKNELLKKIQNLKEDLEYQTYMTDKTIYAVAHKKLQHLKELQFLKDMTKPVEFTPELIQQIVNETFEHLELSGIEYEPKKKDLAQRIKRHVSL